MVYRLLKVRGVSVNDGKRLVFNLFLLGMEVSRDVILPSGGLMEAADRPCLVQLFFTQFSQK